MPVESPSLQIGPVERVSFGGIPIAFDSSVLRPRLWTVAQSLHAAHLLQSLPPGPVLELCAGAGHIGLLAVKEQPRALVQVDSSPRAYHFARENADSLGLGDLVDVRCAPLDSALRADEQFALVIADPPWVRHRDIGRFPDDPPAAVDGGKDGLHVALACLRLIARHLMPRGAALLQLGDLTQAHRIERRLPRFGLRARVIREFPGEGVLVELRRS